MNWKAFIKRHKTGSVRASALELSLFCLMTVVFIIFEIYSGEAATGRITNVVRVFKNENPIVFWLAILLQVVLLYVLARASIKQYERSEKLCKTNY